MNIHPLFVHFPIALLSVYCVLEIIRFKFVTQHSAYFYIKATFVILGALTTYPTILTGTIAKSLIHDHTIREIINVHETFAVTTSIFFSVIAIFYFLGWIRRSYPSSFEHSSSKIWNLLVYIEQFITQQWLGIVLALCGLVIIATTGALGGLIVYGPGNDPLSAFLYNLIVK